MRYTNISELYKQVKERELTSKELKRREEIAKDLPDDEFKDRYGKDWMSVKMATATKMAKNEEFVKEDGHQDIPSAIRQCKTIIEDAMQMVSKLQGMNPEESLPTWWTNKLAIASNSMNKMRDYLLVPSMKEEHILKEAMGDLEDLKKVVAELENASKMHLAQSKRVQAHVDMMTKSEDLDEKYDLYHKTFSGAMQHAYDHAKKKMGITVDPKEIDSKVATGPKKPSKGKTNSYRLKGKGGTIQVQVANLDDKKFELNMYKEEVELDEKIPKDTMYALVKNNKVVAKGSKGDMMRKRKKEGGTVYNSPRSKVGDTVNEAVINEQPEHEIKVGNYTTKHFYMCGSAQTTMKKHADKEGAEELTRMQDVFYKMEKDAMDAGGASDEQKKKSQILCDKIIAKAKEVGIANEVDKYMKMHLDSMLKGDPKLGFGRTDMKEQIELGENAKSAFDKIIKSGGIDKKDFEKAKDLYMKKDLMGLKKYIRSLDTAPLEAVMDVISQNDDNAFMKMYPKSKKGQPMVQIAKEGREQVSEMKRGDYALVGKKDDKVADVGRLRDMRNQRVKMGRDKYDVYPARGSAPGDTFVTTACPPVNEDTTMNKDLIDAVTKIMGEAKTMRQLVDPKKEVMVVKNNKVIVVDKKDEDKYLRMGYSLAEKEKLDPVNKDALKKKFDDRKDKDIDNDGDVDSTDKYLHTRRKAVSKAISKENYEIGKDYGKHTREVTPGQSNDDFNKMVDVMQKKNNSMREALAKVWNTTEGKNPFQKTEGEHENSKKTMTGKKPTKVEVDPEVKETKK